MLGFGLSPRHKTISSTITTIDTVIRYKPIPTNEKIEYARITLPRLLFAPADTVYTTTAEVATPDGGEVEVTVQMERREYGDSTYRAVVSGAVIGDIHPTLDEITIYQKNAQTVISAESKKIPMFSPYFSGGVFLNGRGAALGGGVFIKDRFGVGLKYVNYNGESGGLVELTYKFK